MSDLALKCACLVYDHTRALFDGTIKLDGIDASFETADIPSDIFEKMIRDQAFDIAELGLTYCLRLLDAGDSPFVVLPVFLARTFRHSAIFINSKSGIEKPQDLADKTIGELAMYGHDGGIWPKGILSDEFGVSPNQCRWVIGASDWYMPPLDWIPQPHPVDVDVTHISDGKNLGDMLETGEIDALISARVPRCVMARSPKVARLFPDYENVERNYHKRTGIFPIMHGLVMRKDLLAQNPGLAAVIYRGFCEAKNVAVEQYRRGMVEMNIKSLVPWLTPLLDRNGRALPDDWWPYGVAANRKAVDTFLRYFFEQGLSTRRYTCEDIFVPELLDT